MKVWWYHRAFPALAMSYGMYIASAASVAMVPETMDRPEAAARQLPFFFSAHC
jgi:hypothetical protein